MLVIKIELWPGGDSTRVREIATAKISRVTPGDGDVHNYDFLVAEKWFALVRKPVNCRGTVVAHDRRESVWRLVRKVLNVALPWQDGDG